MALPIAGGLDSDNEVVVVADAIQQRKTGKAAKKQRARSQPTEQAPIQPMFTNLGEYYRLGSGECV